MRSGCVRVTGSFFYIAKLRHSQIAIIRWRTLRYEFWVFLGGYGALAIA